VTLRILYRSSSRAKVSSLTQILILVLALGAGTDYGLFLVFRVREELRAGLSRHDAAPSARTTTWLRLAGGCGQFKPAACRNTRAMTR
jgi:uncharacterized membrane protein YdfJ with MMPL/SSD domain